MTSAPDRVDRVALNTTSSRLTAIRERANALQGRLSVTLEQVKEFEEHCEQVVSWMNKQEACVEAFIYVPLRSSVAQKELKTLMALQDEIKAYRGAGLPKLHLLGQAIFKRCSEAQTEKLKKRMTQIDARFETLIGRAERNLSFISDVIESRAEFEEELEAVKKWFQKAEICLQFDVEALTTHDSLTSQLSHLKSQYHSYRYFTNPLLVNSLPNRVFKGEGGDKSVDS